MKNKKPSEVMTKADVRRELKRIGILFAVLLVLGGVFTWQTSVFKMSNESMSPTIKNGQYVFVNRLAKEYKPGDVIAYIHDKRDGSDNPYEVRIKRLVALPDDDIGFKKGVLYRNKEEVMKLYEPDNPDEMNDEMVEYGVPSDSYFIYGDNGDYQPEKGELSFIYMSDVIGKAVIY